MNLDKDIVDILIKIRGKQQKLKMSELLNSCTNILNQIEYEIKEH